LRYWLVEATECLGARWRFLVEAEQLSAAQVVERMMSLGRVIEVSGQTVDAPRLDLSTVRVKYDATRRHDPVDGARYSIEGKEID